MFTLNYWRTPPGEAGYLIIPHGTLKFWHLYDILSRSRPPPLSPERQILNNHQPIRRPLSRNETKLELQTRARQCVRARIHHMRHRPISCPTSDPSPTFSARLIYHPIRHQNATYQTIRHRHPLRCCRNSHSKGACRCDPLLSIGHHQRHSGST